MIQFIITIVNFLLKTDIEKIFLRKYQYCSHRALPEITKQIDDDGLRIEEESDLDEK